MLVNFNTFKPYTNNYIKNNSTKKSNQQKNVSFKANNLLCADDFYRKANRIFGGNSVEETINRVVKNTVGNNLFGINNGTSSTFFNIPEIKDYGIKIDLDIKKAVNNLKNNKFYPMKDTLYQHNFGQAVFTNTAGIQILKKVQGEPASINNWGFYAEHPWKIQPKTAHEYMHKIFHIAELPEEAYIDLSKKIRIIRSQHEIFLDSKNPNNYMVDFENNKITPIDLRYTNDANYHDTFKDMVNPLTDSQLLSDYKDNLPLCEHFIINDAIKEITDKTTYVLGKIF